MYEYLFSVFTDVYVYVFDCGYGIVVGDFVSYYLCGRSTSALKDLKGELFWKFQWQNIFSMSKENST